MSYRKRTEVCPTCNLNGYRPRGPMRRGKNRFLISSGKTVDKEEVLIESVKARGGLIDGQIITDYFGRPRKVNQRRVLGDGHITRTRIKKIYGRNRPIRPAW